MDPNQRTTCCSSYLDLRRGYVAPARASTAERDATLGALQCAQHEIQNLHAQAWPTPHTTPFFLSPEDPYPVLLRPNSIPE